MGIRREIRSCNPARARLPPGYPAELARGGGPFVRAPESVLGRRPAASAIGSKRQRRSALAPIPGSGGPSGDQAWSLGATASVRKMLARERVERRPRSRHRSTPRFVERAGAREPRSKRPLRWVAGGRERVERSNMVWPDRRPMRRDVLGRLMAYGPAYSLLARRTNRAERARSRDGGRAAEASRKGSLSSTNNGNRKMGRIRRDASLWINCNT